MRMNPDRLGCAEAALRTVPEEYLAVTPEVVAVVDNGHSFHRGMHVGWAWAETRRGWFLDFLSEHRMAGLSAERFHADGTSGHLETPASMHQVTGDAAKDAEIERRFLGGTEPHMSGCAREGFCRQRARISVLRISTSFCSKAVTTDRTHI
jgi:hypothetical protein